MAGWDLSSGDISDVVVFEEEIWRAFNNFFSNNCRKQTTYKYGFLKAILDNLFSVGYYAHRRAYPAAAAGGL